MHNFTSDVFKWASTIKIHPHAVVMNEGMSYRDQNHVLYQAVNEFTGHFNVGHYRDWLASAASLKWPFEELQFWHICFGFILQHQMFGITKNLFLLCSDSSNHCITVSSLEKRIIRFKTLLGSKEWEDDLTSLFFKLIPTQLQPVRGSHITWDTSNVNGINWHAKLMNWYRKLFKKIVFQFYHLFFY